LDGEDLLAREGATRRGALLCRHCAVVADIAETIFFESFVVLKAKVRGIVSIKVTIRGS
jgi:hypothetical protein